MNQFSTGSPTFVVLNLNRFILNFNCPTIITLTITNRLHEVNFETSTACQPACWYAYFHAPKNVAMFSANQIKKPINRNDSIMGISRTIPFVLKRTFVFQNTTNNKTMIHQRRSIINAFVKKFR